MSSTPSSESIELYIYSPGLHLIRLDTPWHGVRQVHSEKYITLLEYNLRSNSSHFLAISCLQIYLTQ